MNLLFPDDFDDEERPPQPRKAVNSDIELNTLQKDRQTAPVKTPVATGAAVSVEGLLFIGDPHLESRVPGFRCDNYSEVILEKFRWCLNYASSNRLQPFLLGDLFQLPQDNPNWLLSEIIDCIEEPLPAIYGNHDVRENFLKPNDSINVLFRSGHLRHVNENSIWTGVIGDQKIVVGGTPWGKKLPKSFETSGESADLVVWITHHDILIPGYEEAGRIRPKPIPGIDVIVNGHIHRRLGTVVREHTHWFTPGNIARRSRSDASKEHLPAVLKLRPVGTDELLNDIQRAIDETNETKKLDRLLLSLNNGQQWLAEWVTVPHQPFEEVFHHQVQGDDETTTGDSGFIADLKELTERRTETGAGLMAYLQTHLENYEGPVATEVRRLADEVINGKQAN